MPPRKPKLSSSPGKLHPGWQPQNSKAKPPASGESRSKGNSPRQGKNNMPSLTLDTETDHTNLSSSRSASPARPTYSPITPTIASASLASSHQPERAALSISRPATEAMPLPPLQPIDFDSNPDVLALQSTIAILQMQARKAEEDMAKLARLKREALANPDEFVRALTAGEIKTTPDPLFHPSAEDDDEEDEVKGEGEIKGEVQNKKKWEAFPTPQNVVRCPPINWNKYAVVGESLEKLHKDQVARPSDGIPQKLGSDGQLIPGGEGQKRAAELGIASPYQPGRDKIEKLGTKKGGKR